MFELKYKGRKIALQQVVVEEDTMEDIENEEFIEKCILIKEKTYFIHKLVQEIILHSKL